jgi:hypothetical protein
MDTIIRPPDLYTLIENKTNINKNNTPILWGVFILRFDTYSYRVYNLDYLSMYCLS